jgi:hypothetical protein
MHRKIAKAVAAAGLVLALCDGMAACGGASPSPAGPTSGSTSAGGESEAAVSGVTVTGSVETSAQTPVAGVTVGFKLDADADSCSTCGLYTAETNASGAYSITLPVGEYTAACAYTGYTCELMTNPPEVAAQVGLEVNSTLDFLVSGAAQPTTEVPTAPASTQQPDQGSGSGTGQITVAARFIGTSSPCSDVDVRVIGPDGQTGPDGFTADEDTGDDGTVTFGNLAPGTYKLYNAAGQDAAPLVNGTEAASTTVTVTAGGNTEVEFGCN